MFFSVKKSVSIGGRMFIPCVCYECGKLYEKPVQELVDKDMAVMWPQRVFFQSGRVIERPAPKKKQAEKSVPEVKAPEQVPEQVPDGEAKQVKKTSKKGS